MTIAELAEQLEVHINKHMEKFSQLGTRVQELEAQAAQSQKEMYTIVQELEPVENLVKLQHPNLAPLFEALKEEYGK